MCQMDTGKNSMKLTANTYISSNWHLDHANILTYCNRPFAKLF